MKKNWREGDKEALGGVRVLEMPQGEKYTDEEVRAWGSGSFHRTKDAMARIRAWRIRSYRQGRNIRIKTEA